MNDNDRERMKEAWRWYLDVAELEQQQSTANFQTESKKGIGKETAGAVLW